MDLSRATREVRGGGGVSTGGAPMDLAVTDGGLFEGHNGDLS